MKTTRKAFLTMALAMVVAAPFPALAADWKPSGTMDMIVPYGPGGAYDLIARAQSKYWEKHLGVKLIVRNVAGAGGTLGMNRVVTSKPDGQTIGLMSQSPYLGELGKSNFPWKVAEVPLIMAVKTPPYVVSTSAKSPYKTWDDLRKATKVVKIGVASQLTTELVLINDLITNGREVTTGSMSTSNIVTSLVAGDLDLWMTVSSDTLMSHVNAGTVRPLVTFDTARAPHLPNVPIHTELGMPAEWKFVNGVRLWFAPIGTPQNVIEGQAKGMTAVLSDPELMKWNQQRGFIQSLISGVEAKETLVGFKKILDDNADLFKKYGG